MTKVSPGGTLQPRPVDTRQEGTSGDTVGGDLQEAAEVENGDQRRALLRMEWVMWFWENGTFLYEDSMAGGGRMVMTTWG